MKEYFKNLWLAIKGSIPVIPVDYSQDRLVFEMHGVILFDATVEQACGLARYSFEPLIKTEKGGELHYKPEK